MYGGENNIKYLDYNISYTNLPKRELRKNNYNYYEELIDLDYLKMKGSSKSFSL